jgi:hypothetical protein
MGELDRFNIEYIEEYCSICERETVHETTVKIDTVSSEADSDPAAREPIRTVQCSECGNTETTHPARRSSTKRVNPPQD